MAKIYLVEYHRQVGDIDVIMATVDKAKAEELCKRKCEETGTRNYGVSAMEDGKEVGT